MLKNAVECVFEVYKEKSFSKAAQKLYISQPALSAAIQKEEAYWGVTFFDRSKNPIELTPEGERLIEAVKQIKEIQCNLEACFEELSMGRMRSLNIGAPAFFCTHVLPSAVKSFKINYPDCKINIIEANDKDLFTGMETDAIDCCISVEKGLPSMSAIRLTEESIVLAVPKSYEINAELEKCQISQGLLFNKWVINTDCPKVSIREFESCPFLLLNKGNDMHERANKIFKQAGIMPSTFMTLEQMMTSYYMATANMGVAFVRAGLMSSSGDDLCFYALDSHYAVRSVNLVVKKNREISPILAAFIQHLQNSFPPI